MQIKKLSLQNFGLIKRCDLEFQPGITVFSGNIGQGKSHLLSSIAFMLVNEKKDTFEDYLNWEEEKFNTYMSFKHKGKLFKFETAFDRKVNSVDRKLTIDDLEPYTGSAVTGLIGDYFDPKLTRAAILAVQGESDLVTSGDANRREILKKIQDLDFTKEAKELEEEAKELESTLLKAIEEKIVILSNKEYLERVLLRLPCNEEGYLGFKEKIQEKDRVIADIQRAIEEYNAKKRGLIEKENYVQSSVQSLSTFKAKIADLSQEVSVLENRLSSEDFEISLRELESKLDSPMTGTLDQYKQRLSDVLEKLATMEKEYVAFDDALIKQAREEREEIVFQLADSKKTLTACENGECPTCGKEFSSDDSEHHRLEIERLGGLLTGVEDKLSSLEQQKKTSDESKVTISQLKNSRDAFTENIEQEEKAVAENKKSIEGEIERERVRIAEKKQNLSDLIASKVELKGNQESSMTDLMLKVSQVEAECESLKVGLPDKEPLIDEQLLQEKEQLVELVRKYDEVIVLNRQIKKENEALVEQRKKDEEQLSIVTDEKVNVEAKIKSIKNCAIILKREFPNYVIQKTLSEIELGMNLFLDKTYNGRYHVSIEENKNGIKIGYGSRKKDIRLSSGGEQDLFNLGLKIALARKAKLDILLLDEIDKFWSTEQSRTVFSTLHSLIEDGKFNQVFVITHNDYVKEVLESDFRATIFIVKEGGVS